MRILDQILAGNAPQLNETIGLADFKDALQDMETFDINNVAEYWYAQKNQRDWDIARDFPSLAPPFSNFWMEHARPPEIITKDGVFSGAGLPRRSAFWFIAEDPKTAENWTQKEGARWMLTCFAFFQPERHAPIEGPMATQTVLVDEHGAALERHMHLRTDEADKEVKAPNLYKLWNPALLAINFLHCKNVAIARDESPDPDLSKYQRKRGLALARIVFKTLNITPMKAVLEKAAAGTPGDLKHALHICRGHFANYEQGGLLFGKYQGRFWVPQHLRGNLDKGIVHKTYNMKAPAK